MENDSLSKKEMGINQEVKREKQIIISLTSHGKRIHDVHIAIESLLRQSVKADKIILWLGEDETTPISEVLKNQVKRGLEVCYCEDLRAYTKIIPTLKRHPDDIIITVDDDIIYAYDMVEILYNRYMETKGEYVVFNRGYEMTKASNGKLTKYDEWPYVSNNENPSLNFFPTGVGGVLYPPGCFSSDVLNEEIFMKLSPFADDIWLKAMSLKNDTKCIKVKDVRSWGDRHLTIKNGQDIALSLINNGEDRNDKQLEAVFSKYNLYDKIKD
jgi:hypothetical protein